MTTKNIIDTLKQGVPVTARLVREIIVKLERLDWAESSLNAALRKYADTAVALSLEESRWVCDALDDHERLKEAVRWERECREVFAWLNNTLANVRADLEAHRSLIAARKAVENLL